MSVINDWYVEEFVEVNEWWQWEESIKYTITRNKAIKKTQVEERDPALKWGKIGNKYDYVHFMNKPDYISD